jgi:phospho-N-acetylmuramoyl-pentapeptide-transferase
VLLFFVQWLSHQFNQTLPAAFSYTSTRMALAAAVSMLLTIVIGPFFIKRLYALKIGQTIRKEECPLLGKLHANKENTPTMGGVLVLCSLFISLVLFMNLQSSFTLILTVTTLGFGFIGALDDYLKLKHSNTKGLSGKKKFFMQTGVAILISLYLLCPLIQEFFHIGNWFSPPIAKLAYASSQEVVPYTTVMYQIFFPFLKNPVFVFSTLFTVGLILFYIIVIVGTSNSVNLSDGLDGLATGLLILVGASLALVAFLTNHVEISSYLHILYIEGSGEIAVFLSAFIGASLGFLWYNGYPAQVFMGDTGSIGLGAILGVCAVLLRREFFLALTGGVFVIETCSVIIQVLSYRYRNKKRVFLCAPIHHHYEYKGMAENKVVIRFWIVGLLFAILGIISLKLQ